MTTEDMWHLHRQLHGVGFASNQTNEDLCRFASEMGFRCIPIRGRLDLVRNLFTAAKGKPKTLLAGYPAICSVLTSSLLRRFDAAVLKRLATGQNLILYVTDLPILQNFAFRGGREVDKTARKLEGELFRLASRICAWNETMATFLNNEYSLPRSKQVLFEFLDFGVSGSPIQGRPPGSESTIVLAGNLIEQQLGTKIRALPASSDLRYEFYGPDGSWISHLSRPDIHFMGSIPPAKLVGQLSRRAHFGLVLRDYEDARVLQYLELGTTSKFSAYMVAGIPALVPRRHQYLSSLVERYEVGYVFDDLKDIPAVTKLAKATDYEQRRENSWTLGRKLSAGFFFKKAVREALKSLGVGNFPNEVPDLKADYDAH